MTKKEKEEQKKLEKNRIEAGKNLEEAIKSKENAGDEDIEKFDIEVEKRAKETEEAIKKEEGFKSKFEIESQKIKSITVINGCGSNLHYKKSGVVLMYKEEPNKTGHLTPAKAKINEEEMEKWLEDHKEMMNNESYKKRVEEGIIKVEIEYE